MWVLPKPETMLRVIYTIKLMLGLVVTLILQISLSPLRRMIKKPVMVETLVESSYTLETLIIQGVIQLCIFHIQETKSWSIFFCLLK